MAANKIKLSRAFRESAIQSLNRLHQLSIVAENSEVDLSRFKFAYEELACIKEKFEKHHSELISQLAVTDGDLISEEETYATFTEKTLDIRIKYGSLFVSQCSTETSSVASVQNKPNVKLPKIDLPRFSGHFKEWPAFIDLFNSLIHLNTTLSDVEKFQYLQTSLVKEPLDLIRGYSLSADNYVLAYDALIKQYENKRKLVASYWEDILNSTTKVSLQHLVNTYSENLSMLKRLGYTVDGFADYIVTHSLMSKLDVSIRERFEREHNSNEIPTFKDLMAFLEVECRAQDAISHNSKIPLDTRKAKSALVSTTTAKDTSHSVKSTCPFCRQSHNVYSCRQFLNKVPRDRHKFVKENNRCINCLGSHKFNDCLSKNTCRQCRRPHHTLLHFEKTPDTAAAHSSLSSRSAPSRGWGIVIPAYKPHGYARK